jgi:hypothetical protein
LTDLQEAQVKWLTDLVAIRKIQRKDGALCTTLHNLQHVADSEKAVELTHAFNVPLGRAGDDVLQHGSRFNVRERFGICKGESTPVIPVVQTQAESEVSKPLPRVQHGAAAGQEIEVARAVRRTGQVFVQLLQGPTPANERASLMSAIPLITSEEPQR